MGNEAAPVQSVAPRDEVEFDADYYRDNYGLEPEDIQQEVVFGSYRGTFEQALRDEKCPIGGILRQAYADGGLSEVQAKVEGFKILDPNFGITFSEASLLRDALVKKK